MGHLADDEEGIHHDTGEENFGGYDSVIEIVNRLGNRAYISYSYPNQVSKIGYRKTARFVMTNPIRLKLARV